jgi:hypothetical protein
MKSTASTVNAYGLVTPVSVDVDAALGNMQWWSGCCGSAVLACATKPRARFQPECQPRLLSQGQFLRKGSFQNKPPIRRREVARNRPLGMAAQWRRDGFRARATPSARSSLHGFIARAILPLARFARLPRPSYSPLAHASVYDFLAQAILLLRTRRCMASSLQAMLLLRTRRCMASLPRLFSFCALVVAVEPALTEVSKHEPALTKVSKHQPALTEVSKHEPALTEVLKYEPALTEVSKHEPTLTEVSKHHCIACNGARALSSWRSVTRGARHRTLNGLPQVPFTSIRIG